MMCLSGNLLIHFTIGLIQKPSRFKVFNFQARPEWCNNIAAHEMSKNVLTKGLVVVLVSAQNSFNDLETLVTSLQACLYSNKLTFLPRLLVISDESLLKAQFHPFGFAAVCYCLKALLLFSLAI